MIKAIVLDCFGVLYIPQDDYFYQTVMANPKAHHDEIRDLVKQSEYGYIDDATLFAGIAEMTGLPVEEITTKLTSGFARNQELIDMLQGLRPQYKLAMLSNLGRNSSVKFFTLEERAKLFDAVVISGEVGMIKPEPGIFEYACRQLGVEPHEAVFVDDAERNCEGARAVGMQAIVYESWPQAQRDLTALLEAGK
ncbi:MAG TPA: HAD family phosphatase [Candidatus Saccharimonadales bacterium]|nr:HAD family phosphatase [Candidatus Saccharimonadales bacterium]